VGTALIYLIVVVVVAGVVFVLAGLVFGRGEELAPLPPGATPTRLPAEAVRGDDVRELRFQQALRGYRMGEVDWVLDRLAEELDRVTGERDRVTDERNALALRVRELETALPRAEGDR
jgi:DivIVA domain-containing protein